MHQTNLAMRVRAVDGRRKPFVYNLLIQKPDARGLPLQRAAG